MPTTSPTVSDDPSAFISAALDKQRTNVVDDHDDVLHRPSDSDVLAEKS